MSIDTVNDAINWQKKSLNQKSMYFRMKNVQFGLKTVVNSIEAQSCLLRISSKLDIGTEILFSI